MPNRIVQDDLAGDPSPAPADRANCVIGRMGCRGRFSAPTLLITWFGMLGGTNAAGGRESRRGRTERCLSEKFRSSSPPMVPRRDASFPLPDGTASSTLAQHGSFRSLELLREWARRPAGSRPSGGGERLRENYEIGVSAVQGTLAGSGGYRVAITAGKRGPPPEGRRPGAERVARKLRAPRSNPEQGGRPDRAKTRPDQARSVGRLSCAGICGCLGWGHRPP